MSGYFALLRDPVVARPFVSSVVARIPIATAPLGLVLLVRSARDNYTLAGIVTGLFAVGLAVGSPLWGRAMDRLGQPRVLVPAASVSGLLLLLLTGATVWTAVPGVVLPVLALLAGAAFPPLSPAMRSTWRVVVTEERRRRRGYALDAAAVETIFVGGPLLLSVLLLLGVAPLPLLVTVVLLVGGTLAYCRSEGARRVVPHPVPEHAHAGAALLRSGGFVLLMAVMAVMSVGFGILDVSMAGLAEHLLGSADRLGLLFAPIAGGSALGGLLYGSRDWRSPDRRRLLVTLTVFGLLLFAVAAGAGEGVPLPVLLVVLFATGLFISPNLIAAQGLVDLLAPDHRLGEAQAWLSTAITAGAAVGNAVAGVLLDVAGARTALTVAASAVLAAAVVCAVAQRSWAARHRPALAVH
ncbi:MFS transporter [Kineococcus rhizosphaerae]|uniref:Putative MFS family arabinose efflux permease n=1 Tax=Kineococcus rhizosphaerae TaxID=559628 RepID=A0A2T0R4T4_9ACTN|nr:MFS transporter [Kineococcus rhizosphaerae]PRY15349.1 putative MFS family arabinose efflux permease [Kineococcus rhizosphaerae]